MTDSRGKQAGFTLIELAVVLLVVGLLAAGLLRPLGVQLEVRDRAATQALLERARDALYGYAITRGRLPCPDADGDGRSDPPFDPLQRTSARCRVLSGFLPGAELGVEAVDAWGNRLLYRVTAPRYTWPDSDGLCNGQRQDELDLCARGDIEVHSRGDNPATPGVIEGKTEFTVADDVPALVLSAGRNGWGATPAQGGVPRAAPTGADERENADGNARFMLRWYTTGAQRCSDSGDESLPLCEFDDLLVWLSPTVLNERLVAARRLP